MSKQSVCINCLIPLTSNNFYIKNKKLYCVNCALLEYKNDIVSLPVLRRNFHILMVFLYIFWTLFIIFQQENIIIGSFLFLLPASCAYVIALPYNTYLHDSAVVHSNYITEILQNDPTSVDRAKYSKELNHILIHFSMILFSFAILFILFISYLIIIHR